MKLAHLAASLLMILCLPVPALAQTKPHVLKVVELRYFPVKDGQIDTAHTNGWTRPLAETEAKVERLSRETAKTLTEGSRYQAYKYPNRVPSLRYEIVHTRSFHEAMPTIPHKREAGKLSVDYHKIFKDNNIEKWVNEHGVQEVWIWSYPNLLGMWESNMAGPYGDISNSDRDQDDLPVYNHTYTLYSYNYEREVDEAVHNHIHQIEAVLNDADKRHQTPRDQWKDLLFWGKFVGSDETAKIITPRAGWCHYPPNAEKDYDYANQRYVETDMLDWRPAGGQKTRMNCTQWDCRQVKFFELWMQSLPGRENTLTHEGKRLHNWWIFLADFDYTKKHALGLTQ